MTSSAPDVLFELRNAFYLGNFQQAINEALRVKVTSSEQQLEKDIFMYRSYVAQKKYGVVCDEINASKASQLQDIKYLATYLAADHNKRENILKDLETKIQTLDANDWVQCLMFATIYYYENNLETALRVLHSSDNIECSSMVLQMYVAMDRLDLARKELKRIQETDDDSTLCQLCQASIDLAQGGDKLQDAFYIYQELADKYGASPLLLNGQAVALIGQTKYSEAEALVQEAIDKDSNNAETLINSIVLTQYLGKPPEVTNRYISQLKDSNSNHPFIQDYLAKERELQNVIQSYKI